MAGVTVIGSTGDPVAGDGLKLTAVKGNLHFTQLDVFNTGGVGIQAVGDTSGGTGFELSAAAGQVESTGDSHGILLTDVGIDPGDDFLLSRIVSTGSVRGDELLRVLGGDFSIVDGGAASSLTSSGEAIRVEGGTSAVTFNGVSATRTTVGGAAISGFNHDGSFIMTGGTITHTGGRAIDFDDMDGGSDFTGTTVSTTNHHGKRLVNSAGTHTFPAVVINTAPPALVDALHLENNTGTTNVGGLSVTTNGSRGLFASNAGTLNLTGLANQVTTTGHSAVEMANTIIGGSGVTFASISASNTATNEGIDLDNVSGATFQVTGTATVNTTAGGAAGIDVAASSAPVTINAVNIDLTAGAGIALTGNSGTVTINGGDITGATGVAFDVNGGSGNVTYAGTINNTVDNAVEITGRATAGRTVTLSGNITHDNGAGGFTNHIGIEVSGNMAGSTVLSGASKVIKSGTQNGVHLVTNTGHTIQFTSGGLDVDTTSGIGFNATGGGTVEAVGAGSSIVSTTGTALNVVSTNIGAGDLNFQSISAGTGGSGPVNGIVLNGTGALGGLTVTGDGGASNNGSGGTIQNTTGSGIVLTDTAQVNLGYVNITNPGADGITINNINGFTLNRGTIVDAAGTAPTDKGIDVGNFTTGTAVNGNVNITDTIIGPTVGASPHDSLAAGIGSGTSTWNVTGGTFRRTGNSAINLELRGTAAVTAFSVSGNTFAGAGSATSARGVFANTLDDSVMTLTIQNNVFTNNNIHIDLNQQNDTDPVGGHTFSILNTPTMTGANSHAMNIFAAAGSFGGTFTGTIEGNVIGNAAVVNSGSAIGNGLRININGGSDATVRVHNNTIRQTPLGRGIEIIGRNGTGGLDVTVTNNDVNPQDTSGFPLAAILVQSNCLTTCNTVRSDVRGNTVPAGTNVVDLSNTYLQLVESSTSTLELVDTTSPISGSCATELAATNTGSTSVVGGCALIAGPISTP